MPRHLLPKNKNQMSNPAPGKWIDFSKDFENFYNMIEQNSSESSSQGYSVPSPWERMIHFINIIEDHKNPLHIVYMSYLLDLLEMLFFRDRFEFEIIRHEVTFENNKDSIIREIFELFPFGPEIKKINILTIKTLSNREIVLGGTCPNSLFFISQEITENRYLKRYFRKPVLLKDRPERFQIYIMYYLLPELKSNPDYKVLYNALLEDKGICENCNISFSKLPDENDPLFNNEEGMLDKLRIYKGGILSSGLIINPSKSDQRILPLIINPDHNMVNSVIYDSYKWYKNYKLSELKNKNRFVLPGEQVKYPWISPFHDFFTPFIIQNNVDFNKNNFVLGEESSLSKYTIPLTDLYFTYFDYADVEKYLSISDAGSKGIKVSLDIPTKNGIININKYYHQGVNSNEENILLKFVNEETPVPNVLIWPKINSKQWRLPYYLLVSKSLNDKFDLNVEFYDSKFTPIIYDPSRKTGEQDVTQIEVAALKKLPVYIKLIEKTSKNYNYLILNLSNLTDVENCKNNAIVGFDFGTSHTNVAILIDDHQNDTNCELLKYNSLFDEININKHEFISSISPTDKEIKANPIITDFWKNITNWFLPNVFLNDNSKDYSVNMPFNTRIYIDKRNEHPIPIRDSVISYVKNLNILRINLEEYYNLKWHINNENQVRSEAFLKTIFFLVYAELIKKRVNLESTLFRWAYPKAFSSEQIRNYNIMWSNILNNPNIESYDESKASLMYFNHIGKIEKNSSNLSIVIDVGGGSSDISIWKNGGILMLFSHLWAGNNVIGYKDSNMKIISPLYDIIKERYLYDNKVNENELNSYSGDFKTIYNIMVSKISTQSMKKMTTQDKFNRPRLILLYFYSALFFEIGSQMKNYVNDYTKIDVCLAGNGIRSITWTSPVENKILEDELEIYKTIINFSLRHSDEKVDKDIDFIVSSSNKSEVVYGLCNMDKKFSDMNSVYTPVINENLYVNGNVKECSVEISEFDEIFNEKDNKLSELNLIKEETNLYKFNVYFFNVVKESKLYKDIFSKDEKLKNMDQLLFDLFDDWGKIEGKIRTSMTDNYQKYQTLSSSIFIIGMQDLIKKLNHLLME